MTLSSSILVGNSPVVICNRFLELYLLANDLARDMWAYMYVLLLDHSAFNMPIVELMIYLPFCLPRYIVAASVWTSIRVFFQQVN